MRTLMFSLDTKMLDPQSGVAHRMVEYGKQNELHIVVPSMENNVVALSSTVRVYGSGGKNKIAQFFAMNRRGRKIVVSEKIAAITTQDPFFIGLLGQRISSQYNIPLEVQLHGDYFGSPYYRQTIMSMLKLVLGTRVLERADSVRVVGERVKQSIVKLGIKENKIIVRPVPVDYSPLKDNAVPEDLHKTYAEYSKIFVFLGRFDPVKNIPWLIDVFVEAAKKDPSLLLLVVGDGIQRESLEKKISALVLPKKNIKLLPWATLPLTYYHNADCILFPSLAEGYGLVAMEAAAAGTPLIMNDVGVANFELKPGPKVKILAVNDEKAWIQAILNV